MKLNRYYKYTPYAQEQKQNMHMMREKEDILKDPCWNYRNKNTWNKKHPGW